VGLLPGVGSRRRKDGHEGESKGDRVS